MLFVLLLNYTVVFFHEKVLTLFLLQLRTYKFKKQFYLHATDIEQAAELLLE